MAAVAVVVVVDLADIEAADPDPVAASPEDAAVATDRWRAAPSTMVRCRAVEAISIVVLPAEATQMASTDHFAVVRQMASLEVAAWIHTQALEALKIAVTRSALVVHVASLHAVQVALVLVLVLATLVVLAGHREVDPIA